MTDPTNPIPNQTQNHTRVIDSFLSGAEKKALAWLVRHLPGWVTPDILTGLAILASIITCTGYALTRQSPGYLWLASFGWVLHWFGDSLDGSLARYRKIERPRYGYFVDHLLDSISVILICLGFGASPYMRFDMALMIATAYLLLSIYVYLATEVSGVFRITYANLGPTEVRVLAILANTVIFFVGNPTFHLPLLSFTLTIYDLIAVAFSILALVIVVTSSVSMAVTLNRLDNTARERKKKAKPAKVKIKANRRRPVLRDQQADI